MRHWLLKSEPSSYSIDDLKRDGVTMWDGVRNYQARNFMRDEMKSGDPILFYHSSVDPAGISGIGVVVSGSYADPTQFDPKDMHFDPKAKQDAPRWQLVDVEFVEKFPSLVTLAEIKDDPFLYDMPVVKKGNRLSVQPVSRAHFDRIIKMGRRAVHGPQRK